MRRVFVLMACACVLKQFVAFEAFRDFVEQPEPGLHYLGVVMMRHFGALRHKFFATQRGDVLQTFIVVKIDVFEFILEHMRKITKG